MELVSWAQQNPQLVLGFGGVFLFLFIVSVFVLLKQNDKIKNLENSNTQNKDNLAELEAQKAELETKLKTAAEEGAEKDNRLNEMENRLSDMQQKSDEQNNSLEDKIAEISDLKSSLESAESTLNDTTVERDELKYDYLISILYIKLKEQAEEFYAEFSQDILKGIATMNVAELDLKTAQTIFNMAIELHKKSLEETTLEDNEV